MRGNTPKVTIGMPVFNGSDFLREAVDSILAQTFTDFEIVISDNGSTDETPALCRHYMSTDSRIRYYRNETNRGATWNYNHVFSLAIGEYFRWHGHDDIIAPRYLERCVAVLDQEPNVVLAYPKSIIIDSKGHIVRPHEDKMDLRSSKVNERITGFLPGLCHPVFGLIRREVLATTDLIGGYVGSDEILLWQLVLAGQFHEVNEQLFYRRFHSGASVVANPDFRSRARWFDPNRNVRIYFKTWHHFYLKLQAIKKAHLTSSEKRRLYLSFFRYHASHPGFMIQDFLTLGEATIAHLKSQELKPWKEDSAAISANEQ